MDRVAAIQQALAAGTYEVPATMVADKVIDSMIEAGLKRRFDGIRDRGAATESMGRTMMRHNTRKSEWSGMLVEALHALEHLDAIRLEEMALSCAALVCDRKRAQGDSDPHPQTSRDGGNEAQRSSPSTAFTTE
jgi:hypothetical protein